MDDETAIGETEGGSHYIIVKKKQPGAVLVEEEALCRAAGGFLYKTKTSYKDVKAAVSRGINWDAS